MARTAIWKSIAQSLTRDIADGRYATGAKLPSEAQLSAQFGVNRHTVRRALAELSEQGLLHARRGAGVFVATTPADYPLGKRVRFRQSLRAAGHIPGGEQLAITTRSADPKEAEALQVSAGTLIHICDALSFVDGQPVGLSQSCFDAERFPDLPKIHRDTKSVTATFHALGLNDYTRVWTRITAISASPIQAGHLRLTEGDPLLRSECVNADLSGTPIEYGITYFAGNRIALTVDGEALEA
ncbi:transcriptional regulator, GntR family [Epibacterium ulvae]|uniref:Transcriptional regulator, GntR family n=1 Tax=Epibacterium ulvae TaxID=1156985 RepID=A0A1G5PMT0_9RHOB|nr:phosphonate metabolism transcriptional regulator PhnF [Epibacterium ulvae]SCZ50379.1 transcriptional regulator, GntR family [Epibacterium ulvae]